MALPRVSRSESGWPRSAFVLTVLVILGVSGSIVLMVLLMQFRPGFLGMTHFTQPHHRVHDFTFGFLFGTTVVGMLAQLRRPPENVAGQVMALMPWVVLVLTFTLTDRWVFAPAPLLGALTLLATLLHPTGRDFFRSFRVSRVNPVMLVLVVLAAVPLLGFASTHIGLQRTVANDHAAMGHYGFMAACSITIIGVGLLAGLRPDGWRVTAWVAGSLPALLGLASIVFPADDSSLGRLWGLAAIVWGVAFVAAAEFSRRGGQTSLGRAGARGSIVGTPRWIYTVGIAALALAVLFVIFHLTGGGFRLHTP